MTSVKDVLKSAKSKNRSERAKVAQSYPNIITSTQEEIYEAALDILTAEKLEYALGNTTLSASKMSANLEEELIRNMKAHASLPTGTVSRIKTLLVDDETGDIKKRPGRPSAAHKRLLEEREQLVRDPEEEQEAFKLVKSYMQQDDDEE